MLKKKNAFMSFGIFLEHFLLIQLTNVPYDKEENEMICQAVPQK